MTVGLRARDPEAGLGRLVVYAFCRASARAMLRVCFRARAFHAERVPLRGACLIASNHQSYLDPPLVGSFVTRHLSFVAKSGLFGFKPFAWLISALNSIPIREDTGDAGAIKEVLRRLERGHAVLIFPEGSRCPDGAMQEFKRGVMLLVRRAKCPVVPAAVEGCFEALPRGRVPRPFKRVAVMYGDPITHDELVRAGPDAAVALLGGRIDALRRELRAKLRAESGGRYPAAGPGDGAWTPPVSPRDAAGPAPPSPPQAAEAPPAAPRSAGATRTGS